jgi:hypothetical protein
MQIFRANQLIIQKKRTNETAFPIPLPKTNTYGKQRFLGI